MLLAESSNNRVTHAGRADLGAAFLVDIASAVTLGNHLFAGSFDSLGRFFFLEGVAEHEGHGEDLGERVSDTLASDVRSRTTRIIIGDRTG